MRNVAAIVLHLRDVGDGEINYSGRDAYADTLCGNPVGWDTKDDLAASNCRDCLTIIAERQAKTDEYVAKKAAAKQGEGK
ncbi:hypothetical protein LCGC14_2265210 [marine sediment metagenome]|uniref:Uncharacterized protein n=1 Tax=marine sediment metagenome TaxID=412755 RepID=A0A0F9CYS1_9ZZZZ